VDGKIDLNETDVLGFVKALFTLADRTAKASGGWQGSK